MPYKKSQYGHEKMNPEKNIPNFVSLVLLLFDFETKSQSYSESFIFFVNQNLDLHSLQQNNLVKKVPFEMRNLMSYWNKR